MLIRLVHYRGLPSTAPRKSDHVCIPTEIIEYSKEGVEVYTFRRTPRAQTNVKKRVIRKVSATTRFLEIGSNRVILHGLESDTQLAPLIMWDIAHTLPLQGELGVSGDYRERSFLEREYFADALIFERVERGVRWFRKKSLLPAEQDAGLDSWSFGIPVGPEDATILNKVVERILELDVPNKEILLCGRPSSNFKYFEQVRIVGEDIKAPPVRIGEKKNRLAQEARFPNLCILHDRVYLPKDFYTAVRKFGDFYPLTTFQSLWYDDRNNFSFSRYSDMGMTYTLRSRIERGVMRDGNIERPSVFAPGVFPLSEKSGFYFANALNYSPNHYPTGSLYMCKKSVWLKFPQSELLYWIEFEDLEHAYRAFDGGVPARINPHAITQSIVSRPLLNMATRGVFVEQLRSRPTLRRLGLSMLPLSRKPAIKVSEDKAMQSMLQFWKKWGVEYEPLQIPAAAVKRSKERLRLIVYLLQRVRVPLRDTELRDFIKDFERLVLFDQIPYSLIESMVSDILKLNASPLDVLVNYNPALHNQIDLRWHRRTFYADLNEYFVRRGLLSTIGTWVSAITLRLNKRSYLYLDGGILTYRRAIINSTPYAT